MALKLFAVGLAITGVCSLAFWLTLDARLPVDDDYRAVNTLVAQQAGPDDAIVLAPSWATRGRDFLTTRPVFTLADFHNGELVGVPRIWLVALEGAPRFELDDARTRLGESAGEPNPVGALYVEPFDTGAAPVAWRLSDEIAEARVRIAGKKVQPCPWRRDHFQCPRGEWNAVHSGWFEVEETPMRCVWAHPVGPEPLEITIENVPSGATLRGRSALIGQAAAGGGAPIDLTVSRDGAPLGKTRFENRFGRQPFDLTLPPSEVPSTLTFAVTTPNSGMRHFCFDAWVEVAP